MKTLPLKQILENIRPLPWPVNGKIEEKGALTPKQLEATRIYRRHAANSLPNMLMALKMTQQKVCALTCSNHTYHTVICNNARNAILLAEEVRVEP